MPGLNDVRYSEKHTRDEHKSNDALEKCKNAKTADERKTATANNNAVHELRKSSNFAHDIVRPNRPAPRDIAHPHAKSPRHRTTHTQIYTVRAPSARGILPVVGRCSDINCKTVRLYAPRHLPPHAARCASGAGPARPRSIVSLLDQRTAGYDARRVFARLSLAFVFLPSFASFSSSTFSLPSKPLTARIWNSALASPAGWLVFRDFSRLTLSP